jgi:hypothetical protein
MNESANIETVQRLYADFVRGDIPALLAVLDPAVEWINAGPDAIVYAGTRHGLAQVREFFTTLDASIEVQTFEPREFIAQGDRVVALGRWTGRVKTTGREYASDWAMAWTIKNGRVTAFRSYEDTHAMAAAFAG